MDPGHRPRSTPPPLPTTVITEQVDDDDRVSLVPEDDIVGGRLHVMYDRLAHDDYAGARLVAESLLDREPDHHDALQCLDMCHTALQKLYLSRLGELDRIPQLSIEPEQLSARVTDERALQVLQLVNGLRPLGSIADAASTSRLEALRILSELFLSHVIEFEDE